jgi:hypothetical protein
MSIMTIMPIVHQVKDNRRGSYACNGHLQLRGCPQIASETRKCVQQ